MGDGSSYAEDFVALCHSEEEARQALGKIQDFAKANGMRLHPEKTRMMDARKPGGFDFLGYHFERGMKWPRKKIERLAREREVG